MLQHKRTLAGILAATMMFSLTACGGGGATKDPGSDAAQDPNEAAAAGTLQLSEWEESSGIFNTDETDEELYEGRGQGNHLFDFLPYHQGRQCLHGEVSRH